VGDLDALVCAPAGLNVLATLASYPDLRELTGSGTTKADGVSRNGLKHGSEGSN